MLKSEDIDYICGQIENSIGLLQSPKSNLLVAMPKHLRMGLPDLRTDLLIAMAVDICIDDGWANEPPSLFVFLKKILPEDAVVAKILVHIEKRPPPGAASPDPFDAVALDSGLPFLDRTPVRGYLRALLGDFPRQPTVVVNGVRDSGKTYTTELINHACRHHKTVLRCHIEIKEKEGAAIGPSELARDIVTQIGGDPTQIPQKEDTNLERWTKELANWVVSVAMKSSWRCWIVLDGFNKEELRSDTQAFVVRLASVITSGAAQRLHRLILMDFDHTILSVQPGSIAHDVTAWISKSVVEAFVHRLIEQSGHPLDAQPIIADLTQGFPDPIQDLPELNRRLTALMAVVR